MEPEELRKLRKAHGLTTGELADLLDVLPEEVLRWEAPEGSPHHSEIESEDRRRILRELAVFRGRERERELVAIARTNASRLAAQPFVPVLTRR